MYLKIALVIALKILEIFAFCLCFIAPYFIGKIHNNYLKKKFPTTEYGPYLDYKSKFTYVYSDDCICLFVKGFIIILLCIIIPIIIISILFALYNTIHIWISSNCMLADKIINHFK
jgi:hypothetical protein